MKSLGILVAVAGLGLASPALAQSSTSGTSPATPAPSASAQPGAGMSAGQNSQAAAQKIKQDLQSAGFKDVNVVAQSFVVQAKTKDGNPVVMTIGPHGMSVFEAMNSSSGNSTDQTGSINQNNSQKQ
ncbi:hypothetical protein SLNSH_04190 [Alsobacter soli]|uniref:PepSY domain-containing protein n=1 Tax=Alsobacter soli TaxID=2109933 RepID=A0A2T1HXZ4_9HYPH|nr:hypothetical protein [Alsobacter soli]PSC06484.1 hypothetical protein SLNSH_04190 [Alsobacter soli]